MAGRRAARFRKLERLACRPRAVLPREALEGRATVVVDDGITTRAAVRVARSVARTEGADPVRGRARTPASGGHDAWALDETASSPGEGVWPDIPRAVSLRSVLVGVIGAMARRGHQRGDGRRDGGAYSSDGSDLWCVCEGAQGPR
ncbi:hypothetical protein GCM10022214_38950 [Actinomadura miaoliensis]|uniref:Phosphoribosyltransferase domain-containing protein n=1 Tax=Actinomadura miaoliensis TaxID=430685 RepID=A0ABP7W0F4_9ACTN